MLIQDIVRPNTEAHFQNDVQLAWYPNDPKNLPLATHYIFTGTAPNGRTSAVKLLEHLRESCLHGTENRHVVIATYGHGKTHLALALANYFGKPADSPEVAGILANIKHATKDGIADGFKAFKDGRPPHLVLRLRGDVAESLPQQVLSGLETALQEHPGTQDVRLPFWFDDAITYLDDYSAEERATANDFLAGAPKPTDLSSLRQQLVARDPDAYDTVRAVGKHVRKWAPELGREVSLGDAIQWVADHCCGEGGPAGGLLILFDEFSAFVRHTVSQANTTGHAAPLQDLLNGVVNGGRRVVFVAFCQRDPDQQVADLLASNRNADACEDMRRELNRLPVAQRYLLHTSLETVLDAYLRQDDRAWDRLQQQAPSAIEDATDHVQTLFRERYQERDGWTAETVQKVLTKGSYPLHPVTTALLCSVQLRESVAGARPLLNFVLDSLTRLAKQPALIAANRPNWVYATALVDWFGDMLADEEHRDYASVCRRVGAEVEEIDKAVLKAMLLQSVGQLKWRDMGGYAKVISVLCGCSPTACTEALVRLRDGGFIREESNGSYSFYSAGTGGDLLEKRIDEAVRGKSVSRDTLDELFANAALPLASWNWGHADDNSAAQHVLMRSEFAADRLRKIALSHRWTPHGIEEAARAHVVWLVAQTEEDREWFRANARKVVDEAFKGQEHPPALVVAVPRDVRPAFTRVLLRRQALAGMPRSDRQSFPNEVVLDTEQRYKEQVEQELRAIRNADEYVVPAPYRTYFQVHMHGRQRVTPELAADLCARAAYAHHPPSFYTTFKSTARNLQNAVYEVGRMMAARQHREVEKRFSAAHGGWEVVARELWTKFLQGQRPGSWGLVTLSGIPCEPMASSTLKAWEYLDTVFAPDRGPVAVKDALIPLLNSPFGYDCNQAMLLFCAWYGMRCHHLQVQQSGAITNLDRIFKALPERERKPKDFLVHICCIREVQISRREGDDASEIEDIVSRIGRGDVSETVALEWKAQLEEFATDGLGDPGLTERAKTGIRDLDTALEKLEAYRKEAQGLLDGARGSRDVGALARCLSQVGSLPRHSFVTPEAELKEAAVRKAIQASLGEAVDAHCAKYSHLASIDDYTAQQRMLVSIRSHLEGAGDAGLLARLEGAERELTARYQVLQDEAADAELVARLKGIAVSGPLHDLRATSKALRQLKAHGETASKALAAKRAAVESAIESAEAYATALAGRLDALTTARGASDLRDEINKKLHEYEGTKEQEHLSSALGRCVEVADYLARVQALAALQPQTPDHVAAARAAVDEALNTARVSEVQRGLVEQAEAAVARRVEVLQRKAMEWLAAREGEARSGADLVSLAQAIGRVPAFLPRDPQTGARLAAVEQRVRELLNADEKDRDARARDATVMAEVRAMRADASLAGLRAYVRRLDEVHAQHPDTQAVIDERRREFQEAIGQAVTYARSLDERVAQVCSAADAQAQLADIGGRLAAYAGEPEQDMLAAAQTRCKALAALFSRAEALQKEKLASPRIANSLREELGTLAAGMEPPLSAEQLRVLDGIRAAIDQAEAREREEARRWLTRIEKQASKPAEPQKLLDELAAPPAFLPSAERERVVVLQECLQAQVTDAPVMARLRAVRMDDTLSRLRVTRQELLALQPATAECRQRLNDVRAAVSEAIAALEAFVTELPDRIAVAVTPDALRKQSSRIQSQRALYAGTDEDKVLEHELTRCDALETALRELAAITPKGARGEGETTRLRHRVSELRARVQSHLSEEHAGVFEAKMGEIAAYVEEQHQKVREALEDFRARIQRGKDLVAIAERLARPIAFLPADCQQMVKELKDEVQGALDQNAAKTAEEYFRKIKDKAKRDQCLAELQRIAQEMV